MDGFTRTERSKRHIFGGFHICGTCGSGMVIVTGSEKRPMFATAVQVTAIAATVRIVYLV